MDVSWYLLMDTENGVDQCTDLVNHRRRPTFSVLSLDNAPFDTITKEDFFAGRCLLSSAQNALERHEHADSVLEVTLECDHG